MPADLFLHRLGVARLFFSLIALAAPNLAPCASAQTADGFDAWRGSFIERLVADGVDAASAHALLDPVVFAPEAVLARRSLNGFRQPMRDYLAVRTTADRISQGKAAMAENAELLSAISARFHVDRAAIVAVWGMETNYGKAAQPHDAVSALAMFAYAGPRQDYFESELRELVHLITSGRMKRSGLASSADGGMGQPQFMPTSFARYAVDWDEDGSCDIWGDTADVLASIARYLSEAGWRSGAPLFDVALIRGDPHIARQSETRSIAEWQALGVTTVAQPADSRRQARLYQPDGAGGRALLVYENFEAFRRYNGASRYAVAASLLMTSLAGDRAPDAWPGVPGELTLAEISRLQTNLSRLGYAPGTPDGFFGERTWAAMNAFLNDIGHPSRDYPTRDVLDQTRARLR